MGEAHRRTEDLKIVRSSGEERRGLRTRRIIDEFTNHEKCQLVTKKQRTREAYRKRLKNTNNKT